MTKPTHSRSRAGLGSGLRELVIVVVGVMIALAADAAWSERQDRDTEREILESLHVDLDRVAGVLERYRHDDSTMVANADVLLGASVLSDDEVVSLLSRLFYTLPNDVSLPTLEEAISTGRLRLLTDAELRVRLASVRARLAALSTYLEQVEIQVDRVARPALYQRLDFDRFVGTNQHWGTTGRSLGEPIALDPRTDAETRNIIRDRRAFVSVRRNQVRYRLDSIVVLRDAVADQLDNR